MRIRPDPASRRERVASIAAATAITVGAAVLVLVPGRPRRFAEPLALSVHNASQPPERLEYAIAPTPPVAPVLPPTHPKRRVQSPDIAKSEAVITPPIAPPVVADTGTGAPPKAAAFSETTAGTASWRSTISAPAMGSAGAFFHRDAAPIHYDSALGVVRDSLRSEFAGGRPRSAPQTQAERDAQLRAQALAAFAGRNSAGTSPRMISGGASVPIGLPFGGPSREARERDRAIAAQNKEIQARIQRRVDSTLAARRQRHVDSLARVDHATRSALPD